MKYIYASRMGNVEKLIKALHVAAEKIESGNETVNEDYFLFTYTDGKGIVPKAVEKFLNVNGKHLKGVIAAGSKERQPDTFAWAGDIIAKEYGVACLYKMDGPVDDEDVKAIQAVLK